MSETETKATTASCTRCRRHMDVRSMQLEGGILVCKGPLATSCAAMAPAAAKARELLAKARREQKGPAST